MHQAIYSASQENQAENETALLYSKMKIYIRGKEAQYNRNKLEKQEANIVTLLNIKQSNWINNIIF